MEKKNKLTLLFLLFLSYSIGFLIIAFFQTPEQMQWYNTLNQSPLEPPSIVFSIVWSILYLLMSLSAFIVWDKIHHFLFYAQYALQMIWSFTFFQAHLLWAGFAVLVLLCFVTTKIFIQFRKKSPLSGYLFLPYTLWCFFAALLNLTVAFFN